MENRQNMNEKSFLDDLDKNRKQIPRRECIYDIWLFFLEQFEIEKFKKVLF